MTWREDPARIAAVPNLVLSYLAILVGSYAFILLWWSLEWQVVFACALATSTVLVVVTPWGGPYDPTPNNQVDPIASGLIAVITYTAPAYTVALTKSQIVAAITLPIWVGLAARRVYTGSSTEMPLARTAQELINT